jgi:DNA modification methylase
MIDLRLGDCLELMKGLPDASVDAVITSPPYDNLRTYGGHSWNFEGIARELYRVVKDGGVVVWVVGDATIDGSETGTSFRQALYFKDIGFNLHDTMIYEKIGGGAVGSNKAYWQMFEYMFVLSKREPNTINRLKDRANQYAGSILSKSVGGRSPKYAKKSRDTYTIDAFGYRTNIWRFHGAMGNDRTDHPAPFPEALAHDHILSWTNEGDAVLDCFMGSGTTGKMAVKLGRNFIGYEIHEPYFDIAQRRIAEAQQQIALPLVTA